MKIYLVYLAPVFVVFLYPFDLLAFDLCKIAFYEDSNVSINCGKKSIDYMSGDALTIINTNGTRSVFDTIGNFNTVENDAKCYVMKINNDNIFASCKILHPFFATGDSVVIINDTTSFSSLEKIYIQNNSKEIQCRITNISHKQSKITCKEYIDIQNESNMLIISQNIITECDCDIDKKFYFRCAIIGRHNEFLDIDCGKKNKTLRKGISYIDIKSIIDE